MNAATRFAGGEPMKAIKNLLLEDFAYWGAPTNELQLNLFAQQLAGQNPDHIRSAMIHFRDEPGRAFMPKPADLKYWIETQLSGRPGVEEAWAMIPHDEESSVVWTEEMREAFNVARPKLLEGDPIAARMTFKEVYPKLVATAREKGSPVRWEPSLGLDRTTHAPTLLEAVRKGRISQSHAQSLLPGPSLQRGEHLQLVGPDEQLISLDKIRDLAARLEKGPL